MTLDLSTLLKHVKNDCSEKHIVNSSKQVKLVITTINWANSNKTSNEPSMTEKGIRNEENVLNQALPQQ